MVGLQPKLVRQQLNQDRDWKPRVRDLFQRFMKRPGMAKAVVAESELLADGNEFLFSVLPAEAMSEARTKLAKKISGLPAGKVNRCLLYTSPSPRDATLSRMPSSA